MPNEKDNKGNEANQGNQGNRGQSPRERRPDVGQGQTRQGQQPGPGGKEPRTPGQGGMDREDQGNRRNAGQQQKDHQVGQGQGGGSQQDLDKRREAQSGPGATGRPGGRDAEIDDETIGDDASKTEPWRVDQDERPRH